MLVSARRFKELGAGSEVDVRPLEMIDRNAPLTLGGVAEGDEEETAPPEADPS